MILILSGVFIPKWFAVLMLVGLLVTPVPFVLGIRYLLKRDYAATTFVLLLGVLMVSIAATLAIGVEELVPPDAFAVPFGYFAFFVSHIMGSKLLAYAVGALVNLVTIIGMVRYFEKRFGDQHNL